MRKNNLIYLDDIIEACEKILSYTEGINFEYFCGDELLREFVIRKIEIIGEACRSLDKEFVESHPEIPVREASDMRNKLAHEYKSVSFETVWTTVQNDIKPLLTAVKKARSKLA